VKNTSRPVIFKLKVSFLKYQLLLVNEYHSDISEFYLIQYAWERRKINKKIWLKNLRETDLSGGLGTDGRMILKWNLKKWGITCGLDSCGFGQGPMAHMTKNFRV
jgi:hypothetical protein